jgi:hydroxylamine reductase
MIMDQMFCFQCEQTAGCTACTGATGTCGKPSDTARLQDRLTGALIRLAGVAADKTELSNQVYDTLVDGLFVTVTNVDFDAKDIKAHIERTHCVTHSVILQDDSDAMIGDDTPDFDMDAIWDANEDIRSLKSLILFGLRGMAAYAYHARVLGYRDQNVDRFFVDGLHALGQDLSVEELLPIVLKVGEVNLTCMGLLDTANTETFGTPAPTDVTMTIDPGPFIVVSGHDLKDLRLLLEQTADKGVNIYTHGEMLPAHAYPELAKYPQLKGNFGTAWQNQRKEFDGVPGAILFTTNCLMPPCDSYRDRVFTTNTVAFEGTTHIGDDKDFTPVINRAIELGGYASEQHRTGINGGDTLTTGFGHGAILASAGQIVQAVKAGELSHIFLVGGCDGVRKSRDYYTEFVKQTPSDTAILTLACGKYRFNDLDLGQVAGLPRLLDMGQCNDAYGAIQVAIALANAFDCGVNDLPLSIVLSWYEQKAVCILLTLLYLGIQDIYLGPTLPAFLSPNILNYLVEHYRIHPTMTPQEDMKLMMGA